MITEKDKTNINNAAHYVWDYIGHDILDAVILEKELKCKNPVNKFKNLKCTI